MLTKRIIPCLDVKNGKVVKGVKFTQHRVVGDILERALHYCETGADELVFYDITASCDQRTVDHQWITEIARHINIPFCVAGGIRSIKEAEAVLHAGADKISINSPALECPDLINQLADIFGRQCIVIGIDSLLIAGEYKVYQYTGDATKSLCSQRLTAEWIKEVQARGAGEIVLNCMHQDGMRQGYDLLQLKLMRTLANVPLIASGGAGCQEDFVAVFKEAQVDGALAASVFHNGDVSIAQLKKYLLQHQIEMRT